MARQWLRHKKRFLQHPRFSPILSARVACLASLGSRIVSSAFSGLAPGDLDQPMPPRDDEREQADLQALEAKLLSSGNINDAMAPYNACKLIRR